MFRKSLLAIIFILIDDQRVAIVDCIRINKDICYTNTFVRDIRESYAIEEICRRLQAIQAIT
jgi:hypothetical protein